MVTLHFKLSDIGEVQLAIGEPQEFAGILATCAQVTGVEFGGCIAVRDGKVLSAHERVNDSDIIDVYPAISGG